jgi:hypothetical protein
MLIVNLPFPSSLQQHHFYLLVVSAVAEDNDREDGHRASSSISDGYYIRTAMAIAGKLLHSTHQYLELNHINDYD